jgi:hypothetical protein
VPQQVASQLELLFEAGIRGKHNAVALGGEWIDALVLAGALERTGVPR